MIREIFHIGSFSISPFGVALVAALFSAYFQLRWGLRRLGIGDDDDASVIVFTAGVAGIAGGKIYYAILYRDWHLLYDRAGIVWYGCFILGLAGFLWILRHRKLPYGPSFDAAAPALALGYGIGRIGCFLVGDDYGRYTDLPWGVSFEVGLPPTTAGILRREFGLTVPERFSDFDFVKVHPTQLYETALALLIWGFAVWLLRRKLRPGGVVLPTLALLSIERFGIEFLRAKDDRFFGSLTLAQVISLVILVALLVLAWRRRSRAAHTS